MIMPYIQKLVYPDKNFLQEMENCREEKNGNVIKLLKMYRQEWKDFREPSFPLPDNSEIFEDRERFLKILGRYQRNPAKISLCLSLQHYISKENELFKISRKPNFYL
jgi:hypothetical protein